MDYGDIFVGTFRTIWQHKRLWLFGMLGRLIFTIGGIASGVFAIRLLPAWLSFVDRLSSEAVTTPGQIPADLAQQLGTLWAGLLCAAVVGYLANYVVNLIMRGATIGEAFIAWSGQATDTGRGLRTGTARAMHLFMVDLLWWAPIALVLSILAGGAFVALVSTAAFVGGDNGQGAAGASLLLLCCGLPCCLLLLGLATAVIVGTFSPLMYQAAVHSGRPGGPSTLGEAISQGWRLARSHWGAMFILWLLLAALSIAAWLLLAAVSYPLSALASGGLTEWITAVIENAQSGVTAIPAAPAVNTGVLVASTLLDAVLGLLIYGFVGTFGRTMYAEVYRRLSAAERGPAYGPSGGYPAPPASIIPAEAPAVEPGGSRQGGARVYDRPGDLGYSVPEEPPSDEESRPAV